MNFGEIRPNDVVYLKTNGLTAYLPYEYAKKYQTPGAYYSGPLDEECWPLNAARVVKICCHIDAVPDVTVRMICDGQEWELLNTMIYIPTSRVPLDKDGDDYIMSDRLITKMKPAIGYFANNLSREVFLDSPIINSRYVDRKYRPKRIIYNNPATIVFWADGTKTVVKKAQKEKFSPYNAFCAALAKKVFGNNSRVNALVKSGEDQQEKKTKKKEK